MGVGSPGAGEVGTGWDLGGSGDGVKSACNVCQQQYQEKLAKSLMPGGAAEIGIKVIPGFLSNQMDGHSIYSEVKKICEGLTKSSVWGVRIQHI